MNWKTFAEKKQHESSIIRYVYRSKNNWATFKELLDKTGLSKPRLWNHLKNLTKEKPLPVLITKNGVYRINPDYKFIEIPKDSWQNTKERTLKDWREKKKGLRIHPKHLYQWFLEIYIDDYDSFKQWVKHDGLIEYAKSEAARKKLTLSIQEEQEQRKLSKEMLNMLAEREKLVDLWK